MDEKAVGAENIDCELIESRAGKISPLLPLKLLLPLRSMAGYMSKYPGGPGALAEELCRGELGYMLDAGGAMECGGGRGPLLDRDELVS